MKKLFTATVLFALMFTFAQDANAQKQKRMSVSVGSSGSDDDEVFDKKQCENFLVMMKDNAKAKGAKMANKFHASFNAFYAGDCQNTLDLSDKDIKRIVRGDLEYTLSEDE